MLWARIRWDPTLSVGSGSCKKSFRIRIRWIRNEFERSLGTNKYLLKILYTVVICTYFISSARPVTAIRTEYINSRIFSGNTHRLIYAASPRFIHTLLRLHMAPFRADAGGGSYPRGGPLRRPTSDRRRGRLERRCS